MEVRLLGPTEVRGTGGEPRSVGGAKVRSLLALLALSAGRVVSVDRLVDGLYGDDPSPGAANALQQLVSKLRRTLTDIGGPGAGGSLVTRPPGYLLAVDPDEVDAIRFARLVTDARSALAAGRPDRAADALAGALALWRGEPLADVTVEGSGDAERQRLLELHDVAIEERVDAELALGNHAALVAELEMLVAENPLRERRWGQLMIARYRAGNQAGALRAFQQAREVLAEELGIDPGPDLRRVEALVLAQDASLDHRAPRPEPARAGASAGAGAGAAEEPAPGVAEPAAALPRPLTECVGRDRELDMLERLVSSKRLVTLVGPGGVGKTRLATEYALRHADRFRHGVRFVELAAVGEPAAVAPAVRAALGLSDAAGDDGSRGLAASMAGHQALLVLDNCEHLLDCVAEFVATLLAAADGVRVVATSRQGLGLPGEQLLPVPTLPGDAARALFVERALAARPDLVMDGAALDAVDRVCARVDGLPLAIEIAASRVRMFDVGELARRMDERVDLATAGPRTTSARHRTMQAVIDWSHDLLDPREQAMFEALGTFAGPVPLRAIEAMCAGDELLRDDVAEVLAGLVDKSLVTVEHGRGVARFGMLQTVQSSARARAEAAGRGDALRRRHLAVVSSEVGERGVARRRSGQAPVVRRIAREIAEVRAALAFGVEHDPELALDVAGRLSWSWLSSGNIALGRLFLERALAAAPAAPPDVVAYAHIWAAMASPMCGDAPGGVAHGDEAVARSRALGDPVLLGLALAMRAFAGVTLPGDPDRAASLLAEAKELLAGHDWEHALALLVECTTAFVLDTPDAHEVIRAALDGCRRTGNDFGRFAALWRLAQVDLRARRLERARASLREALEVAASMPGATVGIEALSYLAVAEAAGGDLDEGARLADTAVTLVRSSGLQDAHGAISLLARSVVHALGGRPADADVDLAHSRELFDRGGVPALGALNAEAFGAALLAGDHPEVAVRYAANAVRFAAATGGGIPAERNVRLLSGALRATALAAQRAAAR